MNIHHSDHNSLATALAGSPVTIFFQDTAGRFVWFENKQSIWQAEGVADRTDDDLFITSSAVAFSNAKTRSIESGGPETVELTVRPDVFGGAEDRFVKITVRPITDANGSVEGFLCSSIDVSLERQREQTLKTLLMEVAHRSKNMLAMVLSLASQTARSSTTTDGFLRAFTGRVQSLAKSQDAITDRDWTGAHFSELVRLQVTDVAPQGGSRITISGDDPELSPSAAVHVGLALHELMTNALISGALLDPAGRIDIRCDLQGPGKEQGDAVIVWRETPGLRDGGDQPAGGFGRVVMERVVPAAVGGDGVLELSADAVIYTLSVAATHFR